MVKIMSMNNVMALVIAVVATSAMLHTTEAALYKVGDELGWTIPPGGAATYATWASKHSFVVNDILGKQINSPICNLSTLFSSLKFPHACDVYICE